LHHPSLPSFPTRRSSDLQRFLFLAGVGATPAGIRASLPNKPSPNPSSGGSHERISPHCSANCTTPWQRRPRKYVTEHMKRSTKPDRKSTRLNSSHVAISY